MTKNDSQRSLGLLVLCCLIAMVVAAAMVPGAMCHTGAVFSVVCCLLFWAGGCMLLHRCFSDPLTWGAGCVVLYLSLCLRLLLFDYASADYSTFLSSWTSTMDGMTIREALTTPIGDYNMPYLYLLLLITRLPIYDLYGIKLISVLADIFTAIALLKLVSMVTEKELTRLVVFIVSLAIPTAFLNSAYWGQCDSVYAAFCLWGLYWGLQNKPVKSLAMFALGFAFKLQTIFILPILLFLLAEKKLDIKHLPVFPGIFLLVSLPALLAGRTFSDTFSIYLSQTESYPYMSLNAPTFWFLIPSDYYWNMAPAPVLLAGIGALTLLFVFLRYQGKLTAEDFIALSLIFCLAIPWLLPKMHERYFYLAEMLALVYGAMRPRRLWVPVLLELGGFLSYRNYLYGGVTTIPNQYMSIAYGAMLLLLILYTYRELESRLVPETK